MEKLQKNKEKMLDSLKKHIFSDDLKGKIGALISENIAKILKLNFDSFNLIEIENLESILQKFTMKYVHGSEEN